MSYEKERNERLVGAFETIFQLMLSENSTTLKVEFTQDEIPIGMTCSVTNMNELNLSKYIN